MTGKFNEEEMTTRLANLPDYVPRSQVMEILGYKRSKMSQLLRDLQIEAHHSDFLRETVIKKEDVLRLVELKRQNAVISRFRPKEESQGESGG